MSFLQKEIWLPKTRGGRLLLAIFITFAFVYVLTVTSQLIENQYDFKGDYVCNIGFDFPREYPCSVWGTGLAAIAIWLEISAFFGLLPVILPCLFVWMILEGLANRGKAKNINFAPTQNVPVTQSKFSVFGKVLYYLFIGFAIYATVMFGLRIVLGLIFSF